MVCKKFQPNWDSSRPRVYDTWDNNGRTWVIQDLAPEDDEEALDILMEHLVPDEAICIASDLSNDPVSLEEFKQIWRKMLSERMSLGVYTTVGGEKTLVALNACHVAYADGEKEVLEVKGMASQNAFKAVDYIKKVSNGVKHLGLDKALSALGLVVKREYRGDKLGARILAAREPLCLSHGLEGTETLFTGPASQKLAERCGFQTIREISFDELADAGLKFPRNGTILKYMMKKYK
ncbi:hypothetical protein ACJJTC_018871 [Scirpophaga incertulas]